jgi:hypothetical protein
MTELTDRNKQWLEETFDDSVKLHTGMDWLKTLYNSFITLAKDSIKLSQEEINALTRMRDKYPNDLETRELIWNNINILGDIIKIEKENITQYEETLKNGK